MSNDISVFDNARSSAVPARIAKFMETHNNLGVNRQTVPTLSYEGKQWTISLNGVRQTQTTTNADGDEIPVSIMRVVILEANKRRGRTYYQGEYDPANKGGPVCWSEDGVAPHTSCETPQATTCESCPWSVKGSKVNAQGKSIAACSQHRMIAVVPANRLDMPPLRMKLAITSDYDPSGAEESQNWYAFNQYQKWMKSKTISHSAAIVTKMKFDPNVAYPKVLFSGDRWLSDAEMDTVDPLVTGDEVKGLLGGTWTPAGADGKRIDAIPVISEPAVVIPPAKLEVKKAAPAKKAEPKIVEIEETPAPMAQDIDDLLAEWGE